PDDYVRREIEAALERDKRLIPVLVQRAEMPTESQLPPTMHGLAQRQAIDLSDERWQFDVERLVGVITSGMPSRTIDAHTPPTVKTTVPPSSRRPQWLGRRPSPPTSEELQRARRDVLDQVRRHWVETELERPLNTLARIELGLSERPG